ncbi:transposase [Comamonas aquatica]|uniref:transposase n=1 Tax=Comamonas aquatica TaxID=225991 RepID=UPI0021B151B4|nr:transposase [Comamonas aquatica]
MARLPRLTLPGLPHYVLQRGNNLQPIFADAQDYACMKDLLREMGRRFAVELHAYILLPNQLHLLATPETTDSLPQFMQAVGRSYVRGFNNRHGRSGTLWEGRYRGTVLEPQAWLLPAMVVLESQAVTQGLAARAVDYAFSSARHNAGAQVDGMLRLHRAYWSLGDTPFAREAAYAQLLDRGASEEVQEVVLQAALKGWVLGGDSFVQGLQQQTERRLTRQKAGRPVRGDAPIG